MLLLLSEAISLQLILAFDIWAKALKLIPLVGQFTDTGPVHIGIGEHIDA